MIGLAAMAQVWVAGLAGLSQAATGSLVAAVWQGVLLAAAAGLGLRLLPKTPAAVRFAIWFGVFLLVTALPVISLWPHAARAAVGSQDPWFTVDARWSLAIVAVWAVASLVRAGTLVAAALRVRALWKRATPVELEETSGIHPTLHDEAVKDGAPEAACLSNGEQATAKANMGILRFAQNDKVGARGAQICTSDEVDRPTVIGFFSPKILIPSWLLEKLTAAELEQIVMHEAGHLGRADDWMNLLQKIALVIFPLNPALAWVERRLCFERELAVDERVMEAFAGKAGAAKAYASCLATLAEYRLGRRALTLALGALGRESELGRRVGRILRREAGMKPLHSRLVLGGAMLGLVVAATGFERCPQVVGFASQGSETVAREAKWKPTHGDVTAMNGAPEFVVAADGRQMRAVIVAYKTPGKRPIQLVSHVTHQVMTVASTPVAPQAVGGQAGDTGRRPVERRVNGSARMVQTVAHVSSARNQSRTVSDTEPAQPASVVTQWVVVTEWQNGQGTRMVFAAAQTAGAAERDTTADPGATRQQVVGEGPRYAAVPVRGGWLVFQL